MTIHFPRPASIYSVMDVSRSPRAHVCTVESRRAAQIIARLLAERFPQTEFHFQEGAAFGYPDCTPAMRDCARSYEVENLTRKELAAEQHDNPLDLPKWVCFLFHDEFCARLENFPKSVEFTRQESGLIETAELYAENPTHDDLVDLFTEATDAA